MMIRNSEVLKTHK